MAQGKQTPRQKMINLMYLVFIAMLALQIDQEIVRSFYDTQVSLTETRKLTDAKNQLFEYNLSEKAQISPEDKASYDNYMQLKQLGDDLIGDIEGKKQKMMAFSGFKYSETDFDYNTLNSADPATSLFFQGGEESKPSAEAKSMMSKIDVLRNFIVQKFEGEENFQNVVARAKQNIITEYPKKKNGKSWLVHKFYNQPMVAALANLEVLETEIRNIQSDVLSVYLQGKSVMADPNATLVTDTPKTVPPMISNSTHQEDKKEDFTATITWNCIISGLSEPG